MLKNKAHRQSILKLIYFVAKSLILNNKVLVGLSVCIAPTNVFSAPHIYTKLRRFLTIYVIWASISTFVGVGVYRFLTPTPTTFFAPTT